VKVLIIGGGLSGLCLAHALQKERVAFEVFERDATPDARGQGYRLTIDEVGNAALKACLPPRIYETLCRGLAMTG
jgi:2-polyprenyl-6-methoxyphenol hydroxylase-like FAD-dependent oxidoreductase